MHGSTTSTRWNPWPVGIIAFFVCFIALTITFIVFSVRQRTDLVTPDYYEQELRYQEQIDLTKRTQVAGLNATVAYQAAADRLVVSLPEAHAVARPAGTIHLYRPAAAEMDREIALAVDEKGRQTVDASTLAGGPWKVRVRWTLGTVEFFSEQRVIIGRGGASLP